MVIVYLQIDLLESPSAKRIASPINTGTSPSSRLPALGYDNPNVQSPLTINSVTSAPIEQRVNVDIDTILEGATEKLSFEDRLKISSFLSGKYGTVQVLHS